MKNTTTNPITGKDFRDHLLNRQTLHEIRSSIDNIDALETVSYTLFKYLLSLGGVTLRESASWLLKFKGMTAAQQSDFLDIVIDGTSEVDDFNRDAVSLAVNWVAFQVTSSEAKEDRSSTIKWTMTLSDDDKIRFHNQVRDLMEEDDSLSRLMAQVIVKTKWSQNEK